MKGFLSAAALSLAVGEASAHYIFEQFSLNSVQYPVYQYIRKNTNYNSPVTDLTSDDLRCNVGANGTGTETITVKAGDQFTFTLDTPVYHDGPISIYMSKAPGAAADYDGSGGWFKIKDWGPTFNSDGSSTWPLEGSYTYNIPTNIPSGDYLLRIQSLAIHNPWPAGIPQFYTECAQITVTGGGSCNPSPTVLIPGFISDTDPGYTVNIYTNFHNYTIPGPAVYTCGAGGTTPSNPTTTVGTPTPPPTTSFVTSVKTSSTSAAAPPASTSSAASGGSTGGCSTAKYGQCGGQGFSGCTTCASGSTCQAQNSYYSQCL